MERAISDAANISSAKDFGRLPDDQRFGIVPAWVLKLADVAPGPKALYASFCTNADEHGQMWRSLERVAAEFGMSKRQVRRWVRELEDAGLIVCNWSGISTNYLIVRDPAGRAWAQSIKDEAAARRKATCEDTHVREGGHRCP